MKRNIWIGAGAIVVLLIGWWVYRQFVPASRTVGSLIPPGSLMILTSDRLQDTISARVLRTEMSLRQIPVFDEARRRLDRFLYATADSATVIKFISGRQVRYSLHSLSKTTLDFIFYIPITDKDESFLHRLTTPDPRQYRVLSHTFSGEKILDLVSRMNEPIGSFILTDGFLVGSVSGILIENVAKRMHQSLKFSQAEPDFRVDADHLAGVSVRPEVLQALFSNAGSLVRLFLPEELNLQFRQSASRSHLIGYAVDQIGNRRDVADLFADQTPQRIQHANLIPQTTATLYHIAISDAEHFGSSLSRLLGSASSDFLRDRFDQIKPAAQTLYKSLGSDLLLARLESPTGALRQVLILTGKDGKKLANLYQLAAFQAGAKSPASPKDYLGHKLLQLPVPELPASLFSSLFAGFSQSWVTLHNNAVIVANNEEAMQDYLQQVQRGTVWTADTRQAELLNTTLRPANFTALVRLNRAQTTVPPTWPLAWQNLLDQVDPATGSTTLSNLENMAYQASYGNENIQSTVILGRTTRRASRAVLNKLLLRKKVEFEAPLIAAPIVAGNLSDSSAQFYAQNEAGEFVLVTPKGEKIVQSRTDGPIRSNALAVDFLNNGRLQYLFMTDRTLYVADPIRTRNEVTLQAIPLPQGLDPSYLARPRGSQQRNLVALAAHQDGHIYALDRQRKAFIRIMTAPRKGQLQLPFQVMATSSGMNVLGIQADGTLNYWRENGSEFPHFPARIERKNEDESEIRFVGPALIPTGQTLIQTIADEGQLFSINTNGLIAKRTQLYRPVRRGSFRLFPDEEQTNWLLIRAADTEVTILNQQGQRMFDVRALQSERNNVRYHRLGAGIELISVQSGGFTTLYDLNGRIIGERPIPSDFPVVLQFDERSNELSILSGIKQAVQLFSIRLR
ncbi:MULTISPECIES: hypothetical protein [unclassified Spirosoma]|uniref:hypothetical protein n=1 Tax=unclassified Spirosoma TaxID=2621999 RepID=UPI00095CCF4B|nr:MULTISPECIES: hypothetical protein [unclassified Spirosoma]MBN8822483.1 hypothetical protein [Spirosoma sp.]OJW73992.1 MAG: hypothetical protein BGO59_12680 [Spirosoma sp. 48-14]